MEVLDKIIAHELGLTDGKFLTGSVEEPIEKNISDLSVDQKLAAWKHHISQSQPKFSDDEHLVVNMLRNGDLQTLYDSLGKELGAVTTPLGQTEDDAVLWSLQQSYPKFNADELNAELEAMKESPNYEAKAQQALERFNEYINQQQLTEDKTELEGMTNQAMQVADVMQQTFNGMTDLFGFELDEQIKQNAWNDVFEAQNGVAPLIEFLENPEGLAQTALLWNIMPEIQKYVESLHQEIESLKSNNVVMKEQEANLMTGIYDI